MMRGLRRHRARAKREPEKKAPIIDASARADRAEAERDAERGERDKRAYAALAAARHADIDACHGHIEQLTAALVEALPDRVAVAPAGTGGRRSPAPRDIHPTYSSTRRFSSTPTTARLFATLAMANDAPGCEVDETASVALARLFEVNGARGRPRRLTPADPDVGARAVEMIRDVRGIGISLAGLAAATGATRHGVVRAVRRTLGVTPMAYALHSRVREAERRILAGTPIALAATETDFSDQAHLTRRMKRLLGVTPGRLRAR